MQEDGLMVTRLKTQSTPGKAHHLKCTPETVHWGFLDGSLKPVLTVDPGDRVTIECITGNKKWV